MKEMKLGSVFACAAFAVLDVCATAPELAAWYRVDEGLTIEDGKVVKWANGGSLGTSLDLAPAVSAGGDIKLVSSAFGTMPAVKFPGSNYLCTAGGVSTDFGITAQSGNTIFLVAKSTGDRTSGSKHGFYGLKDNTGNNGTRFCAFYADNSGNTVLRTHDYSSSGAVSTQDSSANAVGAGTVFMSRVLYPDGSGRKVSLFLSGKADKVGQNGPSAYVPWASEFRLGHNGLSWNPGNYFDGSIAELRIYNTALTAAERYQVECELAAKYALELKPDTDTVISGRALAACRNEALVLGAQPNGGAPADALSGGGCGNLAVSFGDTPAANVNTLFYVAHDDGAEADCVYGFAGASEARAVSLNLSFAQSYGKRKLYYRADADQPWQALDVAASVDGSSVSFSLAAGWANGQYALSNPLPAPAAWFRADRGITTNANGNVTGWDNFGTFGAALNLTNSLGDASHITIDVLNGKPALRIDHTLGLDFLVNDDVTDLGVSLAGGCTYFGVFTSEDGSERSPFGVDFGGTPRLGFQTASSWNPRCWYGHFYSSGNEGCLPYKEGEQLLGASGWLTGAGESSWNVVASSFGDTLNSWMKQASVKPDLSKKGKILVGGFIQSWGGQMYGRIAEVRIYNHALTAQEYAEVEFELAAHYGLPCADASAEAVKGCLFDRCVFGRDKRRGTNPSVTITSGSCGTLSLTLVGTPDADGDSIIRVGRTDGEGVADMWCIAAGPAARALPLKLTFSSEAFSAAGRTLWRLGGDGVWTTACAAREIVSGSVVYTLPAGWGSGRYRIASEDELTAESVAAWFRADYGVTVNGSGKVTGWANRGTLGAALNLVNANSDAPGIAIADSAFASSPALRFDGTDHLHTAGDVDLGITSAGGAWFVVVKPGNSPNMTVFGLGSSAADAQRFGVFRVNAEPKLSATFFDTTGQIFVPSEASNQVLGFSAWPGNGALVRDGALAGNGRWNGVMCSGVFSVGLQSEFLSWMKRLEGDVAEVRVYDRPLSAQECAGVEFELAARYGLPCADASAAATVGCVFDRRVFGRDKKRGSNPVQTVTQATCGLLTVALVGTPGEDTDSLVRVGRLGREDMEDEWCIAAGAGARELPLALTFASVDAKTLAFRLRHKGESGHWRTLNVTPTITDEGATYVLPASWNSGRYRLAGRTGLFIVVQ